MKSNDITFQIPNQVTSDVVGENVHQCHCGRVAKIIAIIWQHKAVCLQLLIIEGRACFSEDGDELVVFSGGEGKFDMEQISVGLPL